MRLPFANIRMADLKEYAELLWINLSVQWSSFIEFLHVTTQYYSSYSFAKLDLFLLLTYLCHNPFSISKRFLQKKREKNIYSYGETPLTSLSQIAKECQIEAKDSVLELGAGRGRSCFWLANFIGCKVIGIEYIPEFVERANTIKNKFQINNAEFRLGNMLETNYSEATVIYLYGTCLETAEIQKIIAKCKSLKPGTKIITVSYSLAEYSREPIFEVMKRFPVRYPWGIADVYLQIKL